MIQINMKLIKAILKRTENKFLKYILESILEAVTLSQNTCPLQFRNPHYKFDSLKTFKISIR